MRRGRRGVVVEKGSRRVQEEVQCGRREEGRHRKKKKERKVGVEFKKEKQIELTAGYT